MEAITETLYLLAIDTYDMYLYAAAVWPDVLGQKDMDDDLHM
jgi:hypothetical protein